MFSDPGRTPVGLGSLDAYPGVFPAAATLSVDVSGNLVYFCEIVAFTGPSRTLEKSSCVLDEEGVDYVPI